MISAINNLRAREAQFALNAFRTHCDEEDEPEESSIGDLLADLMHLCRRDNYDFDRCIMIARQNFYEEIEEKINAVHEQIQPT